MSAATSRSVHPDEATVLEWLPGADTPHDWMTVDALAGFLAAMYGGWRFTPERVERILAGSRHKGLVVRRRGTGPSPLVAYRRTPTGTALLAVRREQATVAA